MPSWNEYLTNLVNSVRIEFESLDGLTQKDILETCSALACKKPCQIEVFEFDEKASTKTCLVILNDTTQNDLDFKFYRKKQVNTNQIINKLRKEYQVVNKLPRTELKALFDFGVNPSSWAHVSSWTWHYPNKQFVVFFFLENPIVLLPELLANRIRMIWSSRKEGKILEFVEKRINKAASLLRKEIEKIPGDAKGKLSELADSVQHLGSEVSNVRN